MIARSLEALRREMDAGRLDARDVVAEHRHRAATIGPRFNAFTELTDGDAPGAGPLRGIPVAIKDSFVDGGRPPTMGSRVHATWMTGTAAVIDRLRAAGAAMVGFTNLHEWAIGTTSHVTATGPIRNPWDRDRIAGGSSGGSAAAVAAGLCVAAIGSDAGGSVRIPAACCGVVGLKPTYGAIPLEGEVGAGSPVNHAGVLSRSVADAAVLFEVLSGRDVRPIDASLVVGVPDRFYEDVQPRVRAAVEDALALLESSLGGRRTVTAPDLGSSSHAVSGFLLPHMAHLVAADMDERPDAFDPWTLRVLQRGRELEGTSVDLAPFRAAWDDAFDDCDVIAVPTLPAIPPRIEDSKVVLPSGPAVADLAQYALNAPMNTGGVPAIAIPCGEVDGMPVSMTLVAPQGAEDVLFAVGQRLEDVGDRAFVNRVAID